MNKVEALKALYEAITGTTCTGDTIVEVIQQFTTYYESLDATPEEETTP